MAQSPFRHGKISRRQFITGVATASVLAGVGSKDSVAMAQDLVNATPAELLDAIVSQPDPNLAIEALIHIFARSGIAVFEEQAVAPIVPPTAPVSPLAFERWQLTPFVNELATGGSRAAAEYDAMFPTQTDAGDIVPTVGELLVGYYGGATTPGADFTRAYFDRIVSADLNIGAAEVPAPTAIISLLGGEIMGQLQEAVGAAGSLATILGSGPALFDRYNVTSSASTSAWSADTSTGYPPMSWRSQAGVCGVAQAFIDDVINRITTVLTASEAVESIPLIGEILGAVVKGVKIGINIILKAVNALLAPVLGIVRSIGAALSVASIVVGTLTPWSVSLVMRPTRNRFGIDAEVVTGNIDVAAGGWDQIPFPAALRECAAFAGIELPKPTSEDAPVHLSVSQSLPLLSIDNPELRLDISGQAIASYVTSNETSEQAKGDEVTSIAWITSVVEREDLKKLRDDLFAVFFSQLPDLISQVVRPLIGPIANDLTNKLIALTKVSAQQPLFVTYHSPKDDPDETDHPNEGEETGDGCFPGVFQLADPAAAQRRYIPMPIDVTGTNIWDFRADGTVEIMYDNVVMTVHIDPSAVFTFSFVGSQSGTYTDVNGVLSVNITVSNVSVDSDMIALQGDMSGIAPMTGQMNGPYTCGNPVVWQLPFAEIGNVPYELIPLG